MIKGNEVSNFEEISTATFNFYKRLFSYMTSSQPRIMNLFDASLPLESVALLERPFSKEEIKLAVINMNKDKSPKLDRFSMAFYQSCWDMIKEDFLSVFNDFHKIGTLHTGAQTTFITLIPKINGASWLLDYRPISLIRNLYKTIAKVLPIRLRSVMNCVVSNSKSDFINGRKFFDSILVANECIDSWEKKYEHLGFYAKLFLRKLRQSGLRFFKMGSILEGFWFKMDQLDNEICDFSLILHIAQ